MISAVVVLYPLSFFVNSSSECYTVKHIYRPQGSAARTDNLVFSHTRPFTWETRYFTAQDEAKFLTMYTGGAICAETEPWVFDPDLATDKFKNDPVTPNILWRCYQTELLVFVITLFSKFPFRFLALKSVFTSSMRVALDEMHKMICSVLIGKTIQAVFYFFPHLYKILWQTSAIPSLSFPSYHAWFCFA